MKRLAWSILLDLRIQYRSGYPLWAALAAFLCILAFARIPQGDSDPLAPLSSLAFSLCTTLPMVILQALSEKREGTLALLDLTPLRPHEYLTSKAVSLAIPSLVCNTAMVVISRGPYFNPIPFWAGVAAAGILFAFLGFWIAAFARTAGKSLALGLIAALLLLAPYFPCPGSEPGRLLMAHPLAGPAALIRASYEPASLLEWAYGAGASLIWIGIALAACRKAFNRLRSAPRIA